MKYKYLCGDVILMEVIVTRLTLRGKGEDDSPFRRITEVWTTDGTKIAEHDPFNEIRNDRLNP